MGLVKIVEPLLRVIRSLIGSLLSLRGFVTKRRRSVSFERVAKRVPKSFGQAERVSARDEQF